MAFLAKNQTNPVILDATGYTPYVMARLERAAVSGGAENKSDAAVRDYWAREKSNYVLGTYVEKHDKELFRSHWEGEADKKGLHSRVMWEMDKVKARRKLDLDNRRKRLAELLKNEDEMIQQGIKTSVPNEESKQANMQERLKDIRMKKEQKRQEVVKSKQDQQFRANSDDLRRLVSKKVNDQIFTEGMAQIKEKSRLREEEKKVDEMYSEIWQRDAEKKMAHEKKVANCKKEKNLEHSRLLKEQIDRNESQRKAILGTKEEEALLLGEQRRLIELDIEYEKVQKKRKQARLKKDLDKCLKRKLKQKTQDVQEELQQELDFFRQINGEEVENREKKKHMLMKEQQQYLEYLADKIKKEAKFERDIDAMYQRESERIWEQKEKEWEYERNKRQDLTKKTIQECYEQIQAKLEMNRQVQKMRMLYGEQIHKQAAADIEESKEKDRIIRENNFKYQQELLEQIKARERLTQNRKAMELKDTEDFRKSEEEYERKLNDILADPKIDHLHPFRDRRFGSSRN